MKVLRPGVEASVALDLDISFRLLFWVNIIFPNHHVRALTNVVREFSVRVKAEMDFVQEAENMARFRGSSPASGRCAPRDVFDHSPGGACSSWSTATARRSIVSTPQFASGRCRSGR